jgi:hypothetical protein
MTKEEFKIGQFVTKKSNKPFKSTRLVEKIVAFGTNETDPKKSECVIFEDGSICNIKMLKK